MGFKPIKKKTKSNITFVMDCQYDGMVEEFEVNSARRLRGFVEAEQNGRKTWRVDFQLSGGAFFGWTLWEMSGDFNGVNTLKWVLDKDFPQEIKDTIVQHFDDRGYESENKPMPETSESLNEFLDSMSGFVDNTRSRTFEPAGHRTGRRAKFNRDAGRSSWL